MEFAIILAYFGSSFLYAYLSINLPNKFAPLKIAYLLASFFFLMLTFFNISIISHGSISYQIPMNVTQGNQTYEVNATITKLNYSEDLKHLAYTVVYGNGIMLGITIFYMFILFLKEIAKPLEKAVKSLEREE